MISPVVYRSLNGCTLTGNAQTGVVPFVKHYDKPHGVIGAGMVFANLGSSLRSGSLTGDGGLLGDERSQFRREGEVTLP
jgi:hypothetical protein